MPLPYLAWFAMGGVGGFVLARGSHGLSNTVKWAVIGGAGFVAARALKVI